jgi:hypothetical protein
MNEKQFSATSKLLWRGPSWLSTNWYACYGLKKHQNLTDVNLILNKIVERTEKMVYNANFWEYYDPFNGKGGGAKGLGWSTLVLLLHKLFANSI